MSIERPFGWCGPSALDLLADFRKRFEAPIEKRRAELTRAINEMPPEASKEERGAIYDEWESLGGFEQSLHRTIRAFVEEAVKPFQDALTDIAMRTPPMPVLQGTGGSERDRCARAADSVAREYTNESGDGTGKFVAEKIAAIIGSGR